MQQIQNTTLGHRDAQHRHDGHPVCRVRLCRTASQQCAG
jgi:hypothetical protein